MLRRARPDRLVVVGPADGTGPEVYPQGTRGSFRGFGVDLDVRLGPDRGTEPERTGRELPYGFAVGAWLLERTGGPTPPSRASAWGGRPRRSLRGAGPGRRRAGRADRAAGAGRRQRVPHAQAPGYLDERAAPFDAEVGARWERRT